MLTAQELRVLDLTTEIADLMSTDIIGHEASRNGDLAEMVTHVHGIQRMIMSQAAAREYPERLRLLGGLVQRQAESAGFEPA